MLSSYSTKKTLKRAIERLLLKPYIEGLNYEKEISKFYSLEFLLKCLGSCRRQKTSKEQCSSQTEMDTYSSFMFQKWWSLKSLINMTMGLWTSINTSWLTLSLRLNKKSYLTPWTSIKCSKLRMMASIILFTSNMGPSFNFSPKTKRNLPAMKKMF